MCNDWRVQIESARGRSVNDTRNLILDVALEVLGQSPDAGMGDIAAAAGVVRRTVYGHFPTRADLVRTLAQRAVDEIVAVLAEVNAPEGAAEAVWVDFIARVWPLARRYRVLLAPASSGGTPTVSSASRGGSSPSPSPSTTKVSTPRVGSARIALAKPTTAPPPRRVWPISSPIGTAITADSAIARKLYHRCWTIRFPMPAGPPQFAAVVK